jgi:hypothetical protein
MTSLILDEKAEEDDENKLSIVKQTMYKCRISRKVALCTDSVCTYPHVPHTPCEMRALNEESGSYIIASELNCVPGKIV